MRCREGGVKGAKEARVTRSRPGTCSSRTRASSAAMEARVSSSCSPGAVHLAPLRDIIVVVPWKDRGEVEARGMRGTQGESSVKMVVSYRF